MFNKVKNKNKRIATKLSFRIFILLVVVFIIMNLGILDSVNSALMKRELNKLELLADQNAGITDEIMETMLDKQNVIITAIKTSFKMTEKERVDFISNLISSVGEGQDDILSLFYVSEPNAFISNTPDGFSIFTSAGGVNIDNTRFKYVNEEVYNEAKKTKEIAIADPFLKTIDGKQYSVITVFQPILDNTQNVIGMIGSNIDTNVLSSAAYNDGGFESFNNQIICGHKTVIMNSRDLSTIGKKYEEVSTSKEPQKILNAIENAQAITYLDKNIDGKNYYRAFVPFYVGDSEVAWLSGTSISETEFKRQIIPQIIATSIFSIAGLIVLILFCYIGIKNTLKPIALIDNAVQQFTLGNLKTKVDYSSQDEIGNLANNFNKSVNILSSYILDIDYAMGEMSKGNFDIKPIKEFVGDFAAIEKSLNKFIKDMTNTLDRINSIADSVAANAEYVSNGSTSLSQASVEQSNAIEELASTISDILNRINKNNENAKKAGTNVKDSEQQLNLSNTQMQNMIKAMDDITTDSKKIENIIKTIEGIAHQTNILALNASIEAARAGESGKGFAVIAEEVRELASESTKAVKSTSDIISHSINSIEFGSKMALDTASSFDRVVKKSDETVNIVNEICKESQLQLEEINLISDSSNQISDIVRLNSATAQESTALSEELSSQSNILKALVQEFKFNKSLIK